MGIRWGGRCGNARRGEIGNRRGAATSSDGGLVAVVDSARCAAGEDERDGRDARVLRREGGHVWRGVRASRGASWGGGAGQRRGAAARGRRGPLAARGARACVSARDVLADDGGDTTIISQYGYDGSKWQ